ncbi:MAG: DUF1592 domain-containing protein [Verrucomicrobiota bacterium]|jgi:hypothetical protein|nr:DUF1592 domain-containing protein [Verrucomicrobiota bacterium]
MRRLVFILFLLVVLVARADEVFKKDVLPVLHKHCFGCHGEKKQKGDLRLDTLDPDIVQGTSAERWHDALNKINLGEMPPEKEPPLTVSERRKLTGWITQRLKMATDIRRNAGGQAVLRRLNRTEYQYTMTDLLGFEMDYSENLPSDSRSPEGFKNNGASLGMAALQIESSLKTARKALDFILVEGGQGKREVTQINRNNGAMKGPNSRRFSGLSSDRLGRVNFWHGSFKGLPRTGRFTIRVKAYTDRKPNQPVPILYAQYGYFVSGLTLNIMSDAGEIAITSSTPRYYEISGWPEFFPQPEARVPDGKLSGIIALQNALHDGESPPKAINKVIEEKDKKGKIRKKKVKVYPEDPDFPRIIIESVEFVRNDYPSWPPPLHRGIIREGEDLSDSKVVKDILSRFLRRAWRRPVSEEEKGKWLAHYEVIRKQSDTSVAALKETLSAALASPHFLYLSEPFKSDKPRKLNAHELAARLSYFIWSSMPDEELSVLADSGRILEDSVLQGQFERMLKDSRSDRFAKEFCDQWLDLEGVDRVAVNPQYYKNFDNRLKPYMAGETRAFFREILRSNTSALQFLDADFTMLNAPLAKHYGLEGPRSQNFERVSLRGTGRPGGVLGHASTHLAGSDGADSHPIKRAVWIRERLLHDPPNPPPPDVPGVEKSVPNFEKLSVREQLAVHRKKEACADCHRSIDPWGIALERYDVIGLQREKTARRKKPVSAETILPGNHEISGLGDLQKYLINERREQFTKALVTKLLTYALGRSLRLADEPLIEELNAEFSKDDYRLSGLMKNIVTSRPFLSR